MNTSEYEKMTAERLEKLLTKKEKRLIEELEKDGDREFAAIRSGLVGEKSKKNALAAANRILRRNVVAAYRIARENEIYNQLRPTPESILVKLIKVYNRCMQAEPVMEWNSEAKEWVPSGEWQFDARNALKSLELMGKSQGMFTDRVINENRNLSLEEYLAKLDESGEADDME